MPSTDEQKSLKMVVRVGVAYLAQSHHDITAREIPNLIIAPERSIFDEGLIITDAEDFSDDPDVRTFQIIDKYEGTDLEVCATIDRKNFEPATKRGIQYNWEVSLSPEQVLNSTALMISSSLAPGLRALVPTAWLASRYPTLLTRAQARLGKRNKAGRIDSLAVTISTSRLNYGRGYGNPFPESLLPFFFPEDFERASLEAMSAYLKGLTPTWINPYSEADITPPTRPKLQTIEKLLPANKTMRQCNYDFVKLICQAFSEFSVDFSANSSNHPYHGDQSLLHKATGMRIWVELKTAQCEINYTENSTKVRHISGRDRGQTAGKSTFRPHFGWQNGCDYFFTTLSIGPRNQAMTVFPRRALFFSRDSLPRSWFNNYEYKWLVWELPYPDAFKHYEVDLTDPQQMVRDMERVLRTQHFPDPSLVTFKAHAKIPYKERPSEATPADDDEADDDEADDDEADDDEADDDEADEDEADEEVAEERDDDDGRAPTGGKNQHLIALHEGYLGEVLMDYCCESKSGLVLKLGRHVYGRFAFMPYKWSEQECERYRINAELPMTIFDVDSEQPLLMLNFRETLWLDGTNPLTPPRLDVLVRKGSESVVVCTGSNAEPEYPEKSFFLIPSEKLKPESKLRAPLHIFGADPFSAYHIDKTDLVIALTNVAAGLEPVKIGAGGVEIKDRKPYLHLAIEVWQQGRLLWEHPKDWFDFDRF